MGIFLKRNSDKKKEIINKYNSTSHFYDKRYSQIQSKKYDQILKNYVLDRKIILDAGCGTGLLFEYTIDLFKQEKRIFYSYIANDISWNMLMEFKSKLVNLKKQLEVNLILSDLENLPFRKNTFHSIFSATAFQNLPNILNGVKESLRVVKSNGDIILSILKKKINLEELLSYLEPFVKEIIIIKIDTIEDIIIKGKLLKD